MFTSGELSVSYAHVSKQQHADHFHSKKSHMSKNNSLMNTEPAMLSKRIDADRPKQKVLFCQRDDTDDDDALAFQAQPAEDIPRNKLTEKLVRGLQSYI